jgi:hypothetical protein
MEKREICYTENGTESEVKSEVKLEVQNNNLKNTKNTNDMMLGLLDRGIDIFKTVMTNNFSVVRNLCETVKAVSKSVENSFCARSQAEVEISKQRMQVISDTRNAVLDELNKDGLSEPEREKLLHVLDKATPKEEEVQAIIRGTSVAKTALCIIGATAIALLVFKKKKK